MRVNRENFDAIYHEFVNELFTFFLGKVGLKKDVAEELVQETFFALYQSIEKNKEIIDIRKWIYKIGRNKLNDYYRKQYKSAQVISIGEDDISRHSDLDYDIEDEMIKIINAEKVQKTLNQMSELYRCVLVLKYYEGYSQKEIGKMIKKSRKSVDGLIQRAKLRFLELYEGDDDEI